MRASLRTLGIIFFFGTLWGASEVLLWETLRDAGVPRVSSVLTVVALVILAIAARSLPRTGSLVGVAGVAALYRLTTAGPFWCHIVAILALGAIVDGVRLVLPFRASRPIRTGLTAAGLAYGAHFVFAALMTWVYRYGPWARQGSDRLRDYVLISGSIAAVAAAVIVPIAVFLAARASTEKAAGKAGAPSLRAPLAGGVVALLWVLGFVIVR